MHTAPSVEPGPRDLILHPTHLWLTIHESLGHSTELDRALGLEANYAGTSFLTPDKLKAFRDRQRARQRRGGEDGAGLARQLRLRRRRHEQTHAWPLIENGKFVGYQLTRDQAHWLGESRGHACSHAQSWKDVPFQRMPNVNLLPGESPAVARPADREHRRRHPDQGPQQLQHRPPALQLPVQRTDGVGRSRAGEITRLLKDVAYQASTPAFWAACDAICSEEEYCVGGSFFDGKGQPSQANPVSHGCVPARFRQIDVLNTARKV